MTVILESKNTKSFDLCGSSNNLVYVVLGIFFLCVDGALCLVQFLRKYGRKGVCVESKGHGFDVTNFESFHMICEFGVDICVGVETG